MSAEGQNGKGTHGEAAVRAFCSGCNCAQSVLAACAPVLGLTGPEALRLAAGLGAGVGGLRETCGAVLAMAAAIGSRIAPGRPMGDGEKAALYEAVQAAVADFDARFGTHVCKELLADAGIEKRPGDRPEPRTPEYYAKRPCAAFIRFCAERALRAQKP